MGHIWQHSICQRRKFSRLRQSREHSHCTHSSRATGAQIMGAVTDHDAGCSWDIHFISQSQQRRSLWFCSKSAVTADYQVEQF
jgi:hypothetical protein